MAKKAKVQMAELTLEQYQDGLDRSATLAKELNNYNLAALDKVSDKIGELTTVLIKQRSISSTNGGQTNWQLLFAIGALVMSMMTPLYVMMQGSSEDIHVINSQLREDNIREHDDAAALAQLSAALNEVETQFEGVKSEYQLLKEQVDRVVTYDRENVSEIATLKEKINQLHKGM